MKLRNRLILIFISLTVFFLIILNGRYLYANVSYLVNKPTPLVTASKPSAQIFIPPVKVASGQKSLPNKAILVVPKINVSMPIVFGINGNSISSMYDGLNRGVVHYSLSPMPGTMGAAMILGHSSDYIWKNNPYGAAFALLNKLKPGDTMFVEYSDGRRFNFKVNQSVIFNPLSVDSEIELMQAAKVPSLILVSCWPVGSVVKRIAVEAIAIK
ncbi:MAG: Sortase family protein [Parcubacteria group bacterium Licking1014_17]|nr:MAG: Sortase family protein [Parcubacteria group bacterium Licking1014_17]